MRFKNLHFEKLKRDAEHFKPTGNDSYIESYSEFIQYFRGIDIITNHHLIISSHFVYGWMPTVLHLDTNEIEKILHLLNAVKTGHLLLVNEILILKKCVNNSLVGLSKLLHFIEPSNYAIWDSRVYRYLTEKRSTYGIDDPKLYLEYLSGIKSITEHKDYRELHGLIEHHFKYHLEPMRVIEIIMFEAERNRL